MILMCTVVHQLCEFGFRPALEAEASMFLAPSSSDRVLETGGRVHPSTVGCTLRESRLEQRLELAVDALLALTLLPMRR